MRTPEPSANWRGPRLHPSFPGLWDQQAPGRSLEGRLGFESTEPNPSHPEEGPALLGWHLSIQHMLWAWACARQCWGPGGDYKHLALPPWVAQSHAGRQTCLQTVTTQNGL